MNSTHERETSTEKTDVSALSFGPFRVEATKYLWQGRQPVEIRPRSLAMLRYLAERSQQLVTKEELLKRLWPNIYVTKTVLKVCASEIRQALSDDATSPRYIETVGTQGYRFIAPIITTPRVSSPQVSVLRPESESHVQPLTTDTWKLITPFVGRKQELAMLHAAFTQAQAGKRQVVFITGEAGIGKTTLVDRFLEQLRSSKPVRVGRGQCIEQHGAGEAYLPILEALGQLCRDSMGEQVIALLRRYAPMWIMQLPGILEASEVEMLQRQMHGGGRERMLREFVDAIERLTAEQTIVLVLEDLQWSDPSTVELLSSLAQRRGPARVYIVATYRSADVVASGHPLRRVVQELHSHGQCEEATLELLTEEEIIEYLGRRFPDSPAVHALSTTIYNRTDGNALFTVSFVDYLFQRRIVEINGRWEVQTDLATIQRLVPKTAQRLIAKQLEELSSQEQQLLEVASVGGLSFTAAEVAGVTGYPLEDTEEVYEKLAGQERLIKVQSVREWPNQTLTARYQFRHALVQHVLYERLGPVQQVRLHHQLGEWLSTAYGERACEIAAELAVHCEEGRNYQRAVHYRQQAGANALSRNAYTEAGEHLKRGLELLQTSNLPDTQERTHQELALRIPLNVVLLATHSFTADEVEQNLQRALKLCREVSDSVKLVPILAGLTRLQMVRADRTATEELIAQEQNLIEHIHDPTCLVQLHAQLCTAETFRGMHARARKHLTHVLNLYDPQAHASFIWSFGGNPAALVLVTSGWGFCLSGWHDQARSGVERGLAHAEEFFHPFSLTVALLQALQVWQFRGETEQAKRLAGKMLALGHEHSFALYATLGTLTQGCVLVQRGEPAEGIKLLTEGLTQYRATGSRILLQYFLSFLADAYKQQGQVEEGLKVLAEAVHLSETSFDRFWAAEVYRIKGELVLQSGVRSPNSQAENQKAKNKRQKTKIIDPRPLAPDPQSEAEAYFHKAIEIARQQEAKSLELRAVMSLARLWCSQGKRQEAHKLLLDMYNWFTEGFDTADLKNARTLLEVLGTSREEASINRSLS